MAKKNVVIFDGEDKFINPKKAVYSKTRGQAKKVESFKSLRAALMDEEGQGPVEVADDNMSNNQTTVGGGSYAYNAPIEVASQYQIPPPPQSNDSSNGDITSLCPQGYVINILGNCVPAGGEQQTVPSPIPSLPIQVPIIPSLGEIIGGGSSPNVTRNAEYIERPQPIYMAPTPELPSNPYYDDRKTIMPIYEAPPQYISQPITQEPPAYAAPIYEDERRIITPAFPSFPIDERPTPIYNAPTPELPSNPYLDDRKTIMPIYDRPIVAPSPITQEPPSYSAPRLDDDFIIKRPPRLDDAIPPGNETPPNTSPIGGRYPINVINPNPYQPIYIAPVPPSNDDPIRSCPEGMRLSNGTCIPITKVLPPQFDDRNPINPIDRGLPIYEGNPYQPNPIFTAPVPILPTPPPAKIIGDPMGGGGSPVMGGPEIPRPKCPTGFVFNDTTGMCIDKRNPDTEIDPIETPRTTSSTTSTTTKVAAAVPTTTSSTTSTTTKAAVQTTTSSTTTTTTIAIVDKICNPPIYAAPKYYKWVSKGNCAYELVVDDKQLIDAAPAPVLPATGQPIININIPTGTTGGGLGTIPTTSTTVQTTTKSLLPKGGDSGGSGGGGGGSPFPEEPASTGPAPKKNYFWWYVGGAMAIYLLMKRKNKQ